MESPLDIDEKPGRDFVDAGDIEITFRLEGKQKLRYDFNSV